MYANFDESVVGGTESMWNILYGMLTRIKSIVPD